MSLNCDLFQKVDVATVYKNDPELKPDEVKALMDWVNKQPHLPQITEMQGILFLHSCYYSLEKAKNTLDTFFTLRTMCPEMFSQLSLQNPNVANAFNIALIGALPKFTPEGYLVAFNHLMDCDPNKYSFPEQIKILDMMAMAYLNRKGPCNGVIALIDMQGAGVSHLWRINIMTMKKFLFYLQEALPVRLKGLHFINVTPFVDKLVGMMKPFLKKELWEMLHLHSAPNESLYQFVPQECLPEEFGGKAGNLAFLHEQTRQFTQDNIEFFEFEEKQLVDESKRPGKAKNVNDFFGVDGSFKKLMVD